MNPGKKQLHVLLVEDNPGDARLIQELLRESNSTEFEITHAMRLSEAIKEISKRAANIILLDLKLPDGAGLSSVIQIQKAAPEVPLVVLTGLNDEEIAVRAVHQGAQDFLVKGHVDHNLLVRSINYALERHQLLARLNHRYKKEFELSQLKTRLVSMLSHEFNNSLNVIQGAMILLQETESKTTPEKKEYLYEMIKRNIQSLSNMSTNLLNMGRIESGKFAINPKKTEFGNILKESMDHLEIFSKNKGLDISLNFPETPVSVKADPEALALVVTNLLSNAIKYTPDHGKITIGIIPDSINSNQVEIYFQDTGIGIAAEDREKIFTGYYRTKNSKLTTMGFGVGLPLAKDILEAHGSILRVESAPGKGSRFFFTLPVWNDKDLENPFPSTTSRSSFEN
ncbi:MAG: response regulator [Elusimicrobia bacterium]|nr:response regulator [Elusimicrobiota bacterium]